MSHDPVQRTRLTGGELIFGRLGELVSRRPWIVIGCWVALPLVLPMAVPSLTEMSQRHPVAILPADAPSAVTAKKITQAFGQAGSENVLIVLLTDDRGLRAGRRERLSRPGGSAAPRHPRRGDAAGLSQYPTFA